MSDMSASDLEACRKTLALLKSDKHKDKNLVFMDPVDTNIFTTYLDVVEKPMDLTTLGENLENGVYKTRQDFFSDAKTIFKNAQVFHKGKKETAWIIKLGNAMLKIVNREEKNADKKAAAPKKAPSLKLKLSTKSGPAGTTSNAEGPVTSKPKLNLKLGKASAATDSSATASVSSKPAATKPVTSQEAET